MAVRLVITAGVVAALALAGCGKSKPAAEKPAEKSESAAASAPSAAAEGMSGEDFLAKASTLSGTTVTLARCSLLTTPGSDGTLPCRVLDKEGSDIKDASGLPVDIFVSEADLSPEAKAIVAECDSMCTVQISGTLSRSTDGTDYLSMTGVSLTAAG